MAVHTLLVQLCGRGVLLLFSELWQEQAAIRPSGHQGNESSIWHKHLTHCQTTEGVRGRGSCRAYIAPLQPPTSEKWSVNQMATVTSPHTGRPTSKMTVSSCRGGQ